MRGRRLRGSSRPTTEGASEAENRAVSAREPQATTSRVKMSAAISMVECRAVPSGDGRAPGKVFFDHDGSRL
jgi:hypothetical protein